MGGTSYKMLVDSNPGVWREPLHLPLHVATIGAHFRRALPRDAPVVKSGNTRRSRYESNMDYGDRVRYS